MSSQLEDAFNEAVERRTAELRAALEFYANADNYVGGEVGWWADAPGGEHRWCMDFGSIARSALGSDRPPFFTAQQELARCEGYEEGDKLDRDPPEVRRKPADTLLSEQLEEARRWHLTAVNEKLAAQADAERLFTALDGYIMARITGTDLRDYDDLAERAARAHRALATDVPGKLDRTVLDPETGIEEPVTTGRIPDAEFVEPPLMAPAASPDERLREALRDANEYLAQIADYSPSEVADAIDSVRAQIKDALAATDSRGKPDGASVPDQSCATCGGSGDRNGNRRAADPFGTCPGCDGTGVQDRDAAHQFPTQHGFAVTVARALESAAEAVRRERLRIVDLIGSEFPDSMPLLAGDVIGMLQADFLDRAERSEHDERTP